MKELIYNSCLFYNSSIFDIMRIQTDDILILVDNNYNRKGEIAIQIIKIVIKD